MSSENGSPTWNGPRNVIGALGNSGDGAAVEPLMELHRGDDPLLHGHATWALERLGGNAAWEALRSRQDEDPEVREEIALVLASLSP